MFIITFLPEVTSSYSRIGVCVCTGGMCPGPLGPYCSTAIEIMNNLNIYLQQSTESVSFP